VKDKLVSILIAIFGVNWKTTLNGWLLLLCGSETVASTFNWAMLIPPQHQAKMQAICMLFAAFGFMSAKDNNVTHSTISAAEPQKVAQG